MNNGLRRWWPLPLRLFIGVGFILHSFPNLFTAAGHRSFAALLGELGLVRSELAAWIVSGVEFLGGIAILEGALFSLATALLIADMLAAMFAVHLHRGLSYLSLTGWTSAGPQLGMPGAEVNLLYVAALLALFIGGPGPVSVSGLLRRARRPSAAAHPREAHA